MLSISLFILGAAGLLISTNRILTKALLEDEKVNTILFFCISIGIVVLCFVIHFILQRTEFVNFYVSLCSNSTESDDFQKHIILEPTEDVGLVCALDIYLLLLKLIPSSKALE